MTIENIKQNLIRAGSSIDKSGLEETKLKEEVRPSAEKAVKNMLVLGKIANLNDIKVEEDDIVKGFEDMTKGTGYDTNEIRRYYEANNIMDSYRQTLLKEKTLNFLVENATVTEVDSIKKEGDE
jgi:trigger factor